MKQMSTSSRAVHLSAVLGLVGLFAGLMTAAPAQAQDWHYHHWNDNTIKQMDRDAIHRDENRLHNLYDQRKIAQRNHNRDKVRSLNRRIADVRARLDANSYELRRDSHR